MCRKLISDQVRACISPGAVTKLPIIAFGHLATSVSCFRKLLTNRVICLFFDMVIGSKYPSPCSPALTEDTNLDRGTRHGPVFDCASVDLQGDV